MSSRRERKEKIKKRAGAIFAHKQSIETRWRGAEYHLQIFRELFNSSILEKPYQKDIFDKFVWHLGAFYWELVAIFDCTIQALSAYHELGISRSDITWHRVHEKLNELEIQSQLTEKVSSVHESDWFVEVEAIRDRITHWADVWHERLQVDGIVKGVKFGWRMDQIEFSESTLENMKELVECAQANLPERV